MFHTPGRRLSSPFAVEPDSFREPHFQFRAAPYDEPLWFTLHLKSSASHYQGFGERFDSLDQNGPNPDVCVVNQHLRQGTRACIFASVEVVKGDCLS